MRDWRGVNAARSPGQLTDAIAIDREVLIKLRSEAARRETTVPRLIDDLLTVIVDDRLVAAVLDTDDARRAGG